MALVLIYNIAMKQKKTVYLYAATSNLNKNIEYKDLLHKYVLVGSSRDIKQLYNLDKSSVDYLIVFANRKRFSNLDKHQINFLHHAFNNIVVIAKTKINVLNSYAFIPEDLANNSLQTILKIIENGITSSVCYSGDKFKSFCNEVLNQLGFNDSHIGLKYIIDCAYNIACIKSQGSMKKLYQNVAQKYSSNLKAVERCVRAAILCASQTNKYKTYAKTILGSEDKLSNKKFIPSSLS